MVHFKLFHIACLALGLAQLAASLKSDLQPASGISFYEEAVQRAAEAALKAVRSDAQLTLLGAPLETLQVYLGRSHHIGLSIDGVSYEVLLGGEQDLSRQAADRQQALAARTSLPSSSGGSSSPDTAGPSGLVLQHWQEQQQGSLAPLSLPDITLTGPLELVLPQLGPAQFFTPNAVDVGSVRRVRVAPGATVRVAGLKSIALRQPLQLPALPLGFLTEVYAHAQLGEPERGFDNAPGVLYLAQQLQRLALNSSASLLTFDVEPASQDRGLTISSSSPSAPAAPGSTSAGPSRRPGRHAEAEAAAPPPPRLKLKRVKDGSVVLALREGQLSTPAQVCALDLAEASRPWAWPLPHVELSSLVPYEALLRSILTAHPFDLAKVQRKGISIKLTKSEIRGVRLMAFEMEVRSELPANNAEEGDQQGKPVKGLAPDNTQVHIFDVVVQVTEGSGFEGRSPQGLHYRPVSVKLRRTHGSTMTMNRAALDMLKRGGAATNDSAAVPLGFDHHDTGVARQDAV